MAWERWWDWRGWVEARWSQGFVRELIGRVDPEVVPDREVFAEAVTSGARSLMMEHEPWAVDEAAQVHLMMTTHVLAAYRELSARGTTPEEALEAIREAFAAGGRFWIRTFTGLHLALPGDRLRRLRRVAERRAVRDYGEGFAFEMAEEEAGFVMAVKGCLYHAFFVANGCPELTEVFCHWDRNWADAIHPERHGISFDRPTTLAGGGDECRFVFHRTESSR